MIFNRCDYNIGRYNKNNGNETGICIAVWQAGAAAALGFAMLVTIFILSICLCRVCKRTKKQKLSEVITDNPEEVELHYAELQNLPVTNRGQCDGGTSPTPPATQNSDYATVAELQGSNGEGGCNQVEKDGCGLDDEPRENEPLVTQE